MIHPFAIILLRYSGICYLLWKNSSFFHFGGNSGESWQFQGFQTWHTVNSKQKFKLSVFLRIYLINSVTDFPTAVNGLHSKNLLGPQGTLTGSILIGACWYY